MFPKTLYRSSTGEQSSCFVLVSYNTIEGPVHRANVMLTALFRIFSVLVQNVRLTCSINNTALKTQKQHENGRDTARQSTLPSNFIKFLEFSFNTFVSNLY